MWARYKVLLRDLWREFYFIFGYYLCGWGIMRFNFSLKKHLSFQNCRLRLDANCSCERIFFDRDTDCNTLAKNVLFHKELNFKIKVTIKNFNFKRYFSKLVCFKYTSKIKFWIMAPLVFLGGQVDQQSFKNNAT